MELDSFSGKTLRECRIILKNCLDKNISIDEMILQIDNHKSMAIDRPHEPEVSRKNLCPECGGRLVYCGISKIYDCVCGYSRIGGV